MEEQQAAIPSLQKEEHNSIILHSKVQSMSY